MERKRRMGRRELVGFWSDRQVLSAFVNEGIMAHRVLFYFALLVAEPAAGGRGDGGAERCRGVKDVDGGGGDVTASSPAGAPAGRDGQRLLVPFANLLPRLPTLRRIYRGVDAALWEGHEH